MPVTDVTYQSDRNSNPCGYTISTGEDGNGTLRPTISKVFTKTAKTSTERFAYAN